MSDDITKLIAEALEEFTRAKRLADSGGGPIAMANMLLVASRVPALADALESVTAERDTANSRLEAVSEVMNTHRHWNEICGWDVPEIEIRAAIEGPHRGKEEER